MVRVRITGALVALLLPTLMAWPAHAQGGTSAVCSFVISFHLSPGLSLVESSGTLTSRGETGSIACAGTFDGHLVTGPGSLRLDGTVVGTCLSDHGPGTYIFTVPTDAGPLHIAGTYTESSVGPIGHIAGSHPGAGLMGDFVFHPTQGDCVNTPATEALLYGVGVFTG